MAIVSITDRFKISGNLIDVSSVRISDRAGTYGIKRNDTGEVVVIAGTLMTKVSTGVYTYSFEEPIGASGLTYSYRLKWVYQGTTYYDDNDRVFTGSVPDDVVSSRNMDEYLDWLANEFKPLRLITPEETLKQQIENAIRYWNTHSAYKIGDVYDYAPGTKRVQLDSNFKSVVNVIPTKTTTWIWTDHPLWTLTGITVLDNVTSDLIMMSEAFRNYRIYVGTNFRWVFQKSDDPVVGGYLYCVNVPSNVRSVFVIGTKRVTKNEDIKVECILDWILNYTKALVKQIEGNTLRKTAIIDTPIDGQSLVDEGKEEQKTLQEQLARDSKWVVMIRRK